MVGFGGGGGGGGCVAVVAVWEDVTRVYARDSNSVACDGECAQKKKRRIGPGPV